MTPPVASARLELSYPLYASGFDPQNNGFLLVGGGGGEGRTGVGNKIVTNACPYKDRIAADLIVDTDQYF